MTNFALIHGFDAKSGGYVVKIKKINNSWQDSQMDLKFEQ